VATFSLQKEWLYKRRAAVYVTNIKGMVEDIPV
jgi:hypothetical protein